MFCLPPVVPKQLYPLQQIWWCNHGKSRLDIQYTHCVHMLLQVAGTLGPQSHAISLVSDSSTPHVRPVTLKQIVLPSSIRFLQHLLLLH